MKKLFLLPLLLFPILQVTKAQKVYTKNGNISFFSTTAMENIRADNNTVVSVLDSKSGSLQFSVLIKGFHFPKALMEVHFNENYMESDKYPKSSFKGKIKDLTNVKLTQDGSYPVIVSGDLTIHNVTKAASASGTITVKGGVISATSKFNVTLADYNITIPAMVKEKISKTVEITVSCDYTSRM